jgi:hypothetical protein
MHRACRVRKVARALAAGLPAVALAVGMIGGVATAQQPAPPAHECECVDERLAFAAADTDGDGLISEAEFARDVAAAFSALDKGGSGALTSDELGPHDAERFARIDTDGDGELSFAEVMTYKMQAFQAADQNQDGYLSFAEMYEAVLIDLGRNR